GDNSPPIFKDRLQRLIPKLDERRENRFYNEVTDRTEHTSDDLPERSEVFTGTREQVTDPLNAGSDSVKKRSKRLHDRKKHLPQRLHSSVLQPVPLPRERLISGIVSLDDGLPRFRVRVLNNVVHVLDLD